MPLVRVKHMKGSLSRQDRVAIGLEIQESIAHNYSCGGDGDLMLGDVEVEWGKFSRSDLCDFDMMVDVEASDAYDARNNDFGARNDRVKADIRAVLDSLGHTGLTFGLWPKLVRAAWRTG